MTKVKYILSVLAFCALMPAANAQDTGRPAGWHDVRVCTNGNNFRPRLVAIVEKGQFNADFRPENSQNLHAVLVGTMDDNWPEGAGVGFYYRIRSENSRNLPGYLTGLPGVTDIAAVEIEIQSTFATGYIDNNRESFQLPNGVILACSSF
jgi:hypothetical protein